MTDIRKPLTTTLLLIAAVSGMDAAERIVAVETVRPAIVLYRDVTGSYSQHPVVFKEMMYYVGKTYRVVGDCFGVYPRDPDAVPPAQLKWQVGVRIMPGQPLGFGNRLPLAASPDSSISELRDVLKRVKLPAPPYKLKILDGGEAAVLSSTVENAAVDGLSMFQWMADNGYVQMGPTRMEYLSHEESSMRIPVRIVLPVQKRPSGLKSSK